MDVSGRIDEFLAKGYELRDMDTGDPISTIPFDRIVSANAWRIGAFPLVEALATGAQVVIVAGRSTDTVLDARADGASLRLGA